jgi:PAS domain S-box-containing protein
VDRAIGWQAVVHGTTDAVLATNDAGVITCSNARAAMLFGFAQGALDGRSIADFIPGAEYLVADQLGVSNDAVELYGLRRDAGEFPLELTLARLENGDMRICIVMVREILS